MSARTWIGLRAAPPKRPECRSRSAAVTVTSSATRPRSETVIAPRWESLSCDGAAVTRLSEAIGVSPVVAKLLCQRGLDDPDLAARFLNPSLDHLHDPFALADMGAAVDRILATVPCLGGRELEVLANFVGRGVAFLDGAQCVEPIGRAYDRSDPGVLGQRALDQVGVGRIVLDEQDLQSVAVFRHRLVGVVR